MACANPANQMIYQLLLNKAASYTDQPYKARAYKRGAQSISNCPFDLRTKEHPEDIFYIGPSIAKCIKDFFNHPCSISFCPTCPLAEVPNVSQCKVPANQPIYEALMKKAASYPSSATQPVKELYSNAAKAKACRKAAEAVLACDFDIAQNIDRIWRLCGDSLEAFIIDHINATKTSQAATPKLLTPKEVVETVKQNVQARASGGGVSSAQMSSFVRQNALSRDLADADEAEEEEITLIPRTKKLTVQQLIDALQGAIEKNPAVATVQFYTTWDEWDNSGWGPYELSVDDEGVYLHCGDPDIPKY
jgi:hypothetical protein